MQTCTLHQAFLNDRFPHAQATCYDDLMVNVIPIMIFAVFERCQYQTERRFLDQTKYTIPCVSKPVRHPDAGPSVHVIGVNLSLAPSLIVRHSSEQARPCSSLHSSLCPTKSLTMAQDLAYLSWRARYRTFKLQF